MTPSGPESRGSVNAYTIPAELRPWIERTAPTVTDWAQVEHGAAQRRGLVWLHTRSAGPMSGAGITISPKRCRLLLAYCDEVARGLTWDETATLSDLAKSVDGVGAFGSHTLRTAESLADKRLVARRTEGRDLVFGITDWGRTIAERARVLREDGGR